MFRVVAGYLLYGPIQARGLVIQAGPVIQADVSVIQAGLDMRVDVLVMAGVPVLAAAVITARVIGADVASGVIVAVTSFMVAFMAAFIGHGLVLT